MFEWTNKKCKNFNIFSKKVIKTNTWKYHYFTTVYQKSWWFDLQFLRYWAWKTEIGNFGSFFAFFFPPPQKKKKKKLKNQNFQKMKKMPDISSFYTCAPKITIIWYVSWDTKVFFTGITVVDVDLNWLNWFHFLILEIGLLIILIDCMIFPSTFLDVKRMSISTVSFLACTARLWNSLPIECFPLTHDLSGFKSRINIHLLTVGSF